MDIIGKPFEPAEKNLNRKKIKNREGEKDLKGEEE